MALMNEARDEARRLRHGWIGTEHLVLAMFGGEGGAARDALGKLSVDREQFEKEVGRLVPASDAGAAKETDPLPLAWSVKDALDGVVELGPQRIAPEHVLLAILRRRSGLGYAVLEKMQVDVLRLERELEARLR